MTFIAIFSRFTYISGYVYWPIEFGRTFKQNLKLRPVSGCFYKEFRSEEGSILLVRGGPRNNLGDEIARHLAFSPLQNFFAEISSTRSEEVSCRLRNRGNFEGIGIFADILQGLIFIN